MLALCSALLISACGNGLFNIPRDDPPKPTGTVSGGSSEETTSPAGSGGGAEDTASPSEQPLKPQPEPKPPDDPSPDAPSTNNNAAGVFPFNFTSTDIYGNTVTEETLGEKRLFFVHYWATWCGPCIYEMPDLAQLAMDYGDEVGFIALLLDFDSNPDGARKITESAGIPSSFVMVDPGAAGLKKVVAMVQTGYVPTTVIIDYNGEMLDSPLIGAYGAGYADALDHFLNY